MSGVTIDNERELYVIKTVYGGITTLGFETVFSRQTRLAKWFQERRESLNLNGLLILPSEKGTLRAYAQHEASMKCAEEACRVLNTRCEIDLTSQLIGLEGKRVEVVDSFGNKRRFMVGKSTGWLPVHLEVHNRRSRGGIPVWGVPFQSIKVIA